MKTGKVDEIIASYQGEKGALIPILQDIQLECNYLPEDVLRHVARELGLPLSQVFSVATYYSAFSLTPRGRHLICVCLGTACHVKGGGRILERIERDLGIEPGRTTEDGNFSLETVRCIGCCGLAPVITIDGHAYGRLKQDQLSTILKRYKPQRTPRGEGRARPIKEKKKRA